MTHMFARPREAKLKNKVRGAILRQKKRAGAWRDAKTGRVSGGSKTKKQRRG